MSNWELCPKCDGKGVVIPTNPFFHPVTPERTAEEAMDAYNKEGFMFTTFKDPNTCPVCKGRMIINTITGKPPKK